MLDFKLCMVIPVVVGYYLECVATLQSLPECPTVHFKHHDFNIILQFFLCDIIIVWLIWFLEYWFLGQQSKMLQAKPLYNQVLSMFLNIIQYIINVSTNLLIILFRIIWLFSYDTLWSVNVRLTYRLRASLLWILSY